ncbi:MAG: hypothetical protein ACKVU2_02120 [Saprospiraceae bacterium]
MLLQLSVRSFFPVAFFVLFFGASGTTQVNHNNISLTYSQNFNTMPSNGTSLNFTSNSTITGWYVADNNGNTALTITSNSGSGSGNIYNYGSANSPDRALGSVGLSDPFKEYAWGLRLKNNTGLDAYSVTVTFVGEQWRRSTDPEEHLMSFSYKVSGAPITTFSANESGYSKTPFLNFISPQYSGGVATPLDGNLAANRCSLALNFNVHIPAGHEIMFKWFDRNDPDADHGLAIDDVTVKLSTRVMITDVCTGKMPLTHFMKGFIFDIPDEGSSIPFNEPTQAQLDVWGNAITQVMNAQYSNARFTLGTNNLGYRITSYAQAAEGNLPARTYYILTKDGLGANHWGTYVFSPNAGKPCLSFQAPHPLHDQNTGEQSVYLYRQLDAYHLAVAGAHRCLEPDLTACTGTSGPCREDGFNVISDHAHNTESVFQKTTDVIADARPTERFLQMHGFGSMTDTMLVISNGTRLTPANDRAVQLGNALVAAQPTWKFTTPHTYLNLNKYMGLTNVQGRLLNNYQPDICLSSSPGGTVTGRFLHIEQAPDVRLTSNFAIMKNALSANGICNCAAPMNLTSDESAGDRSPQNAITGLSGLHVRYGTDGLTACVQTTAPEVNFQVTNMAGQVLWENTAPSGSAETTVCLPLGVYTSGMYVLSATTSTGERQAVKFIGW